jgi:hypothetical protein
VAPPGTVVFKLVVFDQQAGFAIIVIKFVNVGVPFRVANRF